MPKGEELRSTRELIEAASSATMDAQAQHKKKTEKEHPGADCFKKGVTPHLMPDCGSSAMQKHTQEAMRQHVERHKSVGQSISGRTESTDNGWIETYFLDGDDRGDPFDHAIRYVISHRHDKIPVNSNILRAVPAVLSFFRGNATSDSIRVLYDIYNIIGVGMGIDNVRGADLLPRYFINNLFTGRRGSLYVMKDSRRDTLVSAAWHIRKGADSGMDRITEKYGDLLPMIYFDELLEMSNKSQESVGESREVVKRFNSAYSSLLNQAKKYGADSVFETMRVRLDGLISDSGVGEFYKDVEVPGDPDDARLGKSVVGNFGSGFRPKVNLGRKAAILEEGTSRIYEKVLEVMIREYYGLAQTSGFTRKYEENKDGGVISSGEWQDFFGENENFIAELLDGHKLEGRVLQSRLVKMAGKFRLSSLVIQPFSNDFLTMPVVLKFSYPVIKDNDSSGLVKYMSGPEEYKWLNLLRSTLINEGINVAVPVLAFGNMLMTAIVPADRNLNGFLSSIENGKINLSLQFRQEVLESVREFTDEVKKKSSQAIYQKLIEEKQDTSVDGDYGIVYGKKDDVCELVLDMGFNPLGETDEERRHGYTNWLVEGEKLQSDLEVIAGAVPDENGNYKKRIKDALKRHMTLIDPVFKTVTNSGIHRKWHAPIIDPDTIPISYSSITII